MEQTAEFTAFAQARQGHLRRVAFLLCGDWHDAQDLTQTALLNLCRFWKRAKKSDSVDAYAHTVLVNAYLTQRRRRRRDHERALDFTRHATPDQYTAHHPELRLTLLAALAQLAPRGRAVLVLRYWEDMSVEATAAVLGCSAGNVKSQSSRALARLREILGDTLFAELADPDADADAAKRAGPNPGGTRLPDARAGRRAALTAANERMVEP